MGGVGTVTTGHLSLVRVEPPPSDPIRHRANRASHATRPTDRCAPRCPARCQVAGENVGAVLEQSLITNVTIAGKLASSIARACHSVAMVKWEYIWRQSYWSEASRSGDYIQSFSYQHVWKPDLKTEHLFPSQDGIDDLGRAGWELVTVVPGEVALVTRTSPQQGDSYSRFPTSMLIFKRPLQSEA